RLRLDLVDLLPHDVPLLVIRLVRVGVDPGVPEPPLPPAGPPALAPFPVLRFPDPGPFYRRFPPPPPPLPPALVRPLGRGQVQVPPGIRRQPHPVPHARLLKSVPVRQVPGQPIDIPHDDHIHPAALDGRDQLPEPVPGDFLKRRVPVIFEGGHHRPAPPPGVTRAPVQLRPHRPGGVV